MLLYLTMEIKKQGLLSIKIPLNRICQNCCFNYCCTFMVIIPEIMQKAICLKKSFWINRYGSKGVLIWNLQHVIFTLRQRLLTDF